MISDTTTRVPNHTPDFLNDRILARIKENLARYARNPAGIDARLKQLDKEWDIERSLEANASTLVVIGTVLGTFLSPWFYLVPFLVGTFLLQHAIQGWCPPVRLFRRMGLRTHAEIATERYGLKILRGDYNDLQLPRDDIGALVEKSYELAKW